MSEAGKTVTIQLVDGSTFAEVGNKTYEVNVNSIDGVKDVDLDLAGIDLEKNPELRGRKYLWASEYVIVGEPTTGGFEVTIQLNSVLDLASLFGTLPQSVLENTTVTSK